MCILRDKQRMTMAITPQLRDTQDPTKSSFQLKFCLASEKMFPTTASQMYRQ